MPRGRGKSLDKPLRAGVIGLGAMGRHHARIYSQLPDVELVGVADLDEKLAAATSEQYRTAGFTDYKQLLNRGLEVVSIAVPTSRHQEVAVAAAEAGSNILVEKPIAHNLESAQAIIDKCEQKGVKLMVGHVERFNPVCRVIKNRIAEMEVISIDISRVGPLPPRIKDVGVVIDLAVHDIDILRYLTNSEFRRVQSLIGRGLTNDREDTALLSFAMENGVLCHITTNWLTPFKVREISIAAKEKLIKGWLIEQKVCEYQRSEEDDSYIAREIVVPYGEPLKLEIKGFLDAIKNDETSPVTGADGFKALEIAIQCLEMGGQ
ncbi:Gfo/Idh/MocA family oxidoreductase [Chloroflexota bacterium]